MTSTPLHFVGETLREWLLMVPLIVVRMTFLALLAGVLVWVLMLPRSETTAPGGDGRHGANLKVGATIALGLQLAIYWLL